MGVYCVCAHAGIDYISVRKLHACACINEYVCMDVHVATCIVVWIWAQDSVSKGSGRGKA